jgi:hypothetical protein
MTPTICLTILALLAMNWIRKDLRSQLSDSVETNREITREHNLLTRTLLGVQPDSPQSTAVISTPPERPRSTEPDVAFGDLAIDEDLMREYQEHLDSYGTLSSKPARTHPQVPQIVPGEIQATLG